MTTLSDLMGHAAMMSDWEIAHDFDDCLLPLAGSSDTATTQLRAYVKARKRASDFDGYRTDRPLGNNHTTVSETDYLDSGRICEAVGCGRPVRTHNPLARFCSQRCQKRGQRAS